MRELELNGIEKFKILIKKILIRKKNYLFIRKKNLKLNV